MTLSPGSGTLDPLPDVLSQGLVSVSTFGFVSFFCSTSLFLYLSWRLVTWHSKTASHPPINQFFLLIYNLLLADIQQAVAFWLNVTALRNNAIIVGTNTCFAQGFFISTGDLASSVFICAIAIHTFLSVVKEYKPSTAVFYSCIGAAWTFIYMMAVLGPIIHGQDFYVRASAWCWINDAYEIERLWLHYFWIFCFMFSTIMIYLFIFLFLRHKSRDMTLDSPKFSYSHLSNIHGATPLMILYPLIYTVCTAPLAAGRIAALAGNDPSLAYFCVAGTMIACNGWLDVLLYASTRADIVFSESPPSEDTGLETFAFLGWGGKLANLGTVTTIEGGDKSVQRSHSRLGLVRGLSRSSSTRSQSSFRFGSRSGSSDNLYSLDKINIEVKGEVIVTVDRIEDQLEGGDLGRQNSTRAWGYTGRTAPTDGKWLV